MATTPTPSLDECYKARARVRHLDFIKYTWQRPDPFLEAKQTPFQKEICQKIDEAISKYKKGISSFICINVCFGHGKSDISSRYLPAHFLGEFPDSEVMVVSHTDKKANEFGAFGRSLVQSKEYKQLYPKVSLAKTNRGVEEWGIEGHFGKSQYFGIGSGTAGMRGNLVVVDDFFGKREHAESKALREKVWQSFTDDIITRRAPVTIVLMVVTPWHVDDPIGRLKKKMAEDPEFPQFEFVSYPAFDNKYASGTLFPERFSSEWYSSQKKFLGEYGTASLMQCNPQLRTGNIIRTDKVQKVASLPEGLRLKRAWDLASSVKETTKDDPDFTVGVKGSVKFLPSSVPGVRIPILYIEDVVRGQWEATQRNNIIISTTIADGPIQSGIEAFGAYKDAYTTIVGVLKGLRQVKKMQLPGDKVAKADPLVPIFEAGNVYMKIAPWNDAFLEVIKAFNGGAHDDDVDALAVLYHMFVEDTMPGLFTC